MERLIFPTTKKEAEKSGIPYSSEANKKALFPSQLKELRKKKGISQETLARDLGVSKSTIGLYETGDTLPDAKTLHDIAIYFDISSDWLLGLSTVPSSNKNVRDVCEYIGLSAEAVSALRLDMQGKGKRRPISKIIDYLIREFYISFLSTHIWNKLKDSTIEEMVLDRKMQDVLIDRKKYNKWRFLSICEDLYDKVEKEISSELKEAAEREMYVDLEKIQRDTEDRLKRICAVRMQKDTK